VGDTVILLTYLNSAWKNTQGTQISFHTTNIMFTTAIDALSESAKTPNNWDGVCATMRSWPNWRYYTGIRLQKLRKITNVSGQPLSGASKIGSRMAMTIVSTQNNDVYGNNHVHCVNHMKHNYTMWHNAKFLTVTAGGTYSHHWALDGKTKTHWQIRYSFIDVAVNNDRRAICELRPSVRSINELAVLPVIILISVYPDVTSSASR